MCIITNNVHYVTKINQAFPIFLVCVEKHGVGLDTRLTVTKLEHVANRRWGLG